MHETTSTCCNTSVSTITDDRYTCLNLHFDLQSVVDKVSTFFREILNVYRGVKRTMEFRLINRVKNVVYKIILKEALKKIIRN